MKIMRHIIKFVRIMLADELRYFADRLDPDFELIRSKILVK
jgi:hypothetical protein